MASRRLHEEPISCIRSPEVPHDGHGTYDLDDIPAAVVARVAEHALGDEPELVLSTTDVTFIR